MTTLSGIDISHFQGSPNFYALRSAGTSFVFQKATQGTTFTDPTLASNRINAHAADIAVGLYHFAASTDPVSEAIYFINHVGSLLPGEMVALDWETTSADPVAWCKAWLDTVAAHYGIRPLIYLNKSTVSAHNWTPVVQGDYGLWLADYDNDPTTVPIEPYWPFVAFKQYTSSGSVPGVVGRVDRDVFEGSAAALARYGYQPAPAPQPQPQPTPTPPPAPAPAPAPSFNVAAWRCAEGDSSAHIQNLQVWFNRNYPAYSHINPTAPNYGPQTVAVVKEFAHRSGISSSDGRNIGPQVAAALARAGFKG